MDFELEPAIQNAAPPYVSYNQYVMFRPGGNNAVDHDEVIPLEDYKARTPMVLDSQSAVAEDGYVLFPGETEKIDFHEVASKQCKRIIKTALEALRTNEVLRICFAQFDSSNIVVTITGQVKFRNVEILRNLDAAELLLRQRANYMTALGIFQNLFIGYPPEDMQDLFDMIQHEFYTAREMFHIHGAVTPMEEYSALYKDMYDYLNCMIDPQELWDILFTLPYVESWKLDISSNSLLTTTYQYNDNRRYVVPVNRRGQTCLHKLQKDGIRNIRMEEDQLECQKKTKSKLSDVELHLIAAMQFLEYLRNRTSHRVEPFKWYTKDQRLYNAVGTERVVYVRFPRIICYLQRELFKRNMLHLVQPYHIIPPAEEPLPNPPAEEPVPIPPAEEPVPNPPAEEPVPIPPAEEPVPNPPAEEPVPIPPAEEPVPNPPAEEPVPIPPAEEPVPNPPAEEPVPIPPAEEPVPNPPAEEPVPEVIYFVPVVIYFAQVHAPLPALAPQPGPEQPYILIEPDSDEEQF